MAAVAGVMAQIDSFSKFFLEQANAGLPISSGPIAASLSAQIRALDEVSPSDATALAATVNASALPRGQGHARPSDLRGDFRADMVVRNVNNV